MTQRSSTGTAGRSARVVPLAAAVVSAALAAASVGRAGEEASFLGADACRRCHAAEFEKWRTSAHALSAREATGGVVPAEVARGDLVQHAPGSTEFGRRGARFTATAAFDDGVASPATIDYVVGLRRLTMLVTRLPDGRCQVLPPMREEPQGPWFDYTALLFGSEGSAAEAPAPSVAPGEPSFWTGPDRSFDARCARCHTSGYEVRPTPPGERGARSSWRTLGVDCEGCHGPGGRHVAFWRGPHEDDATDPMPDLAALPRERGLDTCFACHLEGEPLDAGYAPGGDLFDHVEPTLLDNTVRVDSTGRPLELVYEGTSFLASTCATQGRLSCRDCHDVHGSANPGALLVPASKSASLCGRCHADVVADAKRHTRHPDANLACVHCHLPPVSIERGHGAVHDHTLGTPRPSPTGRDACTWCHQGGRGAPQDASWIDSARLDEEFRARWPTAKSRPAWAAAIAAGRARRAEAGPALAALAVDPKTPRIVRASAARLLGRTGDAGARELPFLASDRDPLIRRAALAALALREDEDANRALRAGLDDPSPSVRVAAARAALEGFRRVKADPDLLAAALPVLEADAVAVPDDHLRWFRLGSARLLAGDDRGALAAFERKLQLDPAARRVRETVETLRRRLTK
jgi:predicted CXXCH cytochrome family protein